MAHPAARARRVEWDRRGRWPTWTSQTARSHRRSWGDLADAALVGRLARPYGKEGDKPTKRGPSLANSTTRYWLVPAITRLLGAAAYALNPELASTYLAEASAVGARLGDKWSLLSQLSSRFRPTPDDGGAYPTGRLRAGEEGSDLCGRDR